MIQRIQSLYLLICTILPIVFIWFIYQNDLGVIILALPDNFDIILTLNVLTSIISFVTIFYYKRRKTQFVLCRLNILLNFSILACFYFVMGVFDIVNLIPIMIRIRIENISFLYWRGRWKIKEQRWRWMIRSWGLKVMWGIKKTEV